MNPSTSQAQASGHGVYLYWIPLGAGGSGFVQLNLRGHHGRRERRPRLVSGDPYTGRLLLSLTPSVPAFTWGRQVPGAGEMWNSNSVISWLLARSGVDVDSVDLPSGGRAPGWQAGVSLARAGSTVV